MSGIQRSLRNSNKLWFKRVFTSQIAMCLWMFRRHELAFRFIYEESAETRRFLGARHWLGWGTQGE